MGREAGLKRRMSDAHEKWMAETFGGRVSRGSGNQPNSPMDVRQHHHEHRFAFAFEGKSTRGKGITVTEELWDKAVEQSIGERPVVGLRWYHDDRLRSHTDLLVIDPDDFHELVDAARRSEGLEIALRQEAGDRDRWREIAERYRSEVQKLRQATLDSFPAPKEFVPNPDDHQ